jgi:excisionase family DNA binding protein
MSERKSSTTPFVNASMKIPEPTQELPIRSSRVRMPLTRTNQVFENLRTPINASNNAFYLVTKEQLAHELALSQSYISKLMSDEGLPYLKIGRAVRFRPKEVVEWLQERQMP